MHPIDPLTPEAFTARILWDAAKEGNLLRFLDVWEKMQVRHAKEVEKSLFAGWSIRLLILLLLLGVWGANLVDIP